MNNLENINYSDHTGKDIVKDIDYVFHTAAFIGGVKQNISHPATMISQNSIMNSNIIKASNYSNVERF